jgi:hypothetical protein
MKHSPCTVQAKQLLAYLTNPAADPNLPTHVAGCHFCQARLLAMAAAAMSRSADRRECEKILDEILQMLGETVMDSTALNRMAVLQAHALLCRDCFSVLQGFSMLEQWVLEDALPQPASDAYRAPDLSFLETRAQWLPGDVAAAVSEAGRTLRLYLAALFQPPPPVMIPVRQIRPAEEPSAGHHILVAQEAVEEQGNISVYLRLYSDASDQALACLEVRAQIAERYDYAGTHIVLRLAGGEDREGITNEAGLIRFEHVPREALEGALVEVTQRDGSNA